MDGLIGQGLRTVVLITTNEELSRLHPAVSHPGRCSQIVEFAPLSVTQANKRLQQWGCDARVKQPTPLADLYAVANGRSRRPALSGVGFR